MQNRILLVNKYITTLFLALVLLPFVSQASCWRTSTPSCGLSGCSGHDWCQSDSATSAHGESCYLNAYGTNYCYHTYSCDTNCGGPPTPTPTPSCSNSDPGAPNLTSPPDRYNCFSSNSILLDWDAVSFGTNCDGNDNRYRVYVDGTMVAEYNSSTTQHTYVGTWGTTHTWYVQASNGARTKNSVTRTFTVSTCARVIGRVWEDINNDGTYSGASEAWSHNPPPASGCSSFVDNDILIRSPNGGASVLSDWQCNSASYYRTTPFSIPGPVGTLTNVQMQLDTPDSIDYPAAYVNWSYARCTVASTCTPWTPTVTGTNTNSATVEISNINGDTTNHLQWQITKNKPPVATISTAVTSGHTLLSPLNQTVYVVPAGSMQQFNSLATETRANSSWRLQIARRPFNPTTRVAPTDAASYVVLGTNSSCMGLNCSATFSDSSTPAGYYVYYPVAQDEIEISSGVGRITNQCNGHPGVNSGAVTGWADCDPTWGDGYQDEVVVLGDNLPTCRSGALGITGPNSMFAYPDGMPYVYPESVGFFNVSTYDLDNTEVKHLWNPNWTNPDGLYPTISQIRIYAAGTTSQGIGPTMQLWLGDNSINGTRTKAQEWVVSNVNPAYAPFTANGTFTNVSSIDVVFPNDATDSTGDRNLFIQKIEITYEVKPGNSLVRTLYPYTEANTGSVYYDRGSVVASPYPLTGDWFDGNSYSAVSQTTGAFGVAAGVMAWSGAYNFPIPIRSGVTGGSYSLSATPMAQNNPPFYDGLPCSGLGIAFDSNPTYTINGTAYQRNSSLSCSAQNIGTNTKIQNTTVTLKDSSGNPLGFNATTDANGNYTFNNVPVYYRPDPFCPTCGAKVCLQQQSASTGVFIAACMQMQPPVSTPVAWSDPALCSPIISTTPSISKGTVATVNLGLDYYQNEKWTMALDGDIYAPGITMDIAVSPNPTFSPYFINRRVDSGSPTTGGFAFIDDANVDFGLPLTQANLSEYGGYGMHLRNNTNIYDFKDKWLVGFVPSIPNHSKKTDNYNPRNAGVYEFNSDRIYTYTLNQFNDWYHDAGYNSYHITGSSKSAVLYILGDISSGDRLTLDKSVRTVSDSEMLLIITNLPVDIPDTLDVDESKLISNTYTVNSSSNGLATDQLTAGFLDFVILSSSDINIKSRYDDLAATTVYDLPVMFYGSLLSKNSVSLGRDLWHIYNSKYPAEMVRYNNKLIPSLMDLIEANPDVANYTGLTTFDIQMIYE